MATTVWGNVNTHDDWGEQVYLTYNVTRTGSKYTVSLVAGIKATTKAISITGSGMLKNSVRVNAGYLWGSSTVSLSSYNSNSADYSLAKNATRQHVSTSYSVDKSKDGSQTLSIFAASDVSWLANMGNYSSSNASYKEVTLTIPQKSRYTLTFNANGGTGTAPDNVLKWDSETAYLPSNTFTRTGYDFVGWGTTTSGGTIYPAGSAYTGNANATFYAIWKSNYVPPTIYNLSAYRSNEAGSSADEGYYASVQFNYTEPELDHTSYSDYVLKVGARQQGATTYTYTTVTGTDGVVSAILPNIDPEHAHDIIAVIEPNGFASVSRTTYVTQAYYVMDINADGTAVGFFMSVQDGASGLYVGGNEYLGLDTNAASGTDKEIYDALVALGWDSDVIV